VVENVDIVAVEIEVAVTDVSDDVLVVPVPVVVVSDVPV
jgi:hypothetical protein